MLNKKALAGTPSTPPVYVEDVFSTYLYTGNDSTQTITNGIDLAGQGGLVWIKPRDLTEFHSLFDTVRGAGYYLSSSQTSAQTLGSTTLTSFNTNGFSLGGATRVNGDPYNNCSWTFRKAEKFFDVVTYTGNGSNRTISHNLGSVPGMIIVKRTDTTGAWQVYHRSLANTEYLVLNTTAAKATGTDRWNSTTPTSTEFSLGTDATVNANTGTYVAYLFAHDAGGFGTAGTDNVISCGSFVTNGSGEATINLGYEPQFVLLKSAGSADQWAIVDVMRGFNQTEYWQLSANNANAESSGGLWNPTATGFYYGIGAPSTTYIYMAIRRPMKTPTSGTEVFSTVARTGTSATATVSAGFPVDLSITRYRDAGGAGWTFDRLRGPTKYIVTNETSAEATDAASLIGFDSNSGVRFGADGTNSFVNYSPNTYANWFFRRATGFFDVVCYTGTGSATTVTHNLGVAPELIIVKCRNSPTNWVTYDANSGNTKFLRLNQTNGLSTFNVWNNTNPTSTVFSVSSDDAVNGSGNTYVAYLFATLAGVSKVGSYTGNGSNQTINCGFTAGARFVLIKRTDSTGDWYVYDTARGIVSGNDPQLKLNTTDAEATGYDAIDPDNSGFIVNNDATNFPINVNNATYIYLAIA